MNSCDLPAQRVSDLLSRYVCYDFHLEHFCIVLMLYFGLCLFLCCCFFFFTWIFFFSLRMVLFWILLWSCMDILYALSLFTFVLSHFSFSIIYFSIDLLPYFFKDCRLSLKTLNIITIHKCHKNTNNEEVILYVLYVRANKCLHRIHKEQIVDKTTKLKKHDYHKFIHKVQRMPVKVMVRQIKCSSYQNVR